MVAITLLALALVGPFVATRNALQGSYVARDQLVASQLAQEGLEYVRFVRDNNYLNNRSWLDGFNSATQNRNRCFSSGATAPSGYCTSNPTLGDFHTTATAMIGYTSTSTLPALHLSSSGLYYQVNPSQPASTESRFKRLVRVQQINATEARVTVWVLWTTNRQPYSVTVTSVLRDWI